MSLNRYAQRRDTNEEVIVSALLAHGFGVFKISKPCDLIVWRPGGSAFLLIEVKTDAGRLTDDQQRFFELTEGLPRIVVRTAEEALEAARRWC